MAIAAFASVLAILLAGILLMRFRKRWLAAFNLAVTNRISSFPLLSFRNCSLDHRHWPLPSPVRRKARFSQ